MLLNASTIDKHRVSCQGNDFYYADELACTDDYLFKIRNTLRYESTEETCKIKRSANLSYVYVVLCLQYTITV